MQIGREQTCDGKRQKITTAQSPQSKVTAIHVHLLIATVAAP
jgi:hypothetical protein